MTVESRTDTLPANMDIQSLFPQGCVRTIRAATQVRFFVAVAVLASLGDAAFAQTASGPAESAKSMWSIIAQGLEWPAYIILIGSVATIALIVEHFVTIRILTINPPPQVSTIRNMIERRAFRECLEATKKSNTFFARVLTASLQHARHGFDAMHEAAVEKAGELSGQMFRKVEYLNILGNLGPLMGLLGTVYGMIVAFHELGASGGAGGDAGGLARGISLALVNTLLGLGLAVIGLLFFGVCRNRVDAMTVRATVQVLDLLEYFRPIPTGGAPVTTAAAG
ncbi:MAG: MotA/TolQ/ExbB proton channel family protein [Phycisphaerae bacterium]